MQETARSVRRAGRRIAVVPTMGALHQGHCSLVRLARERADCVITTIFVNPMQFAPGEDLNRYPRPFEHDVESASGAGSEYVFAPSVDQMYPAGFETSVVVDRLTTVLEGAARPTHFRGVTTIVTKLLLCTQPDIAVFGQKDGQQVVVIKRMIADLNIPVEVVLAPIVREADGLAMSSRNVYLSSEHRNEAPVLFRALQLGEQRVRDGSRDASSVTNAMRNIITRDSSGVVEYISIADAESLEEQAAVRTGKIVMISLAVRFGTTRLIDNVVVQVP